MSRPPRGMQTWAMPFASAVRLAWAEPRMMPPATTTATTTSIAAPNAYPPRRNRRGLALVLPLELRPKRFARVGVRRYETFATVGDGTDRRGPINPANYGLTVCKSPCRTGQRAIAPSAALETSRAYLDKA